METELTRNIKKAIRTYKPIMGTTRTIRWAEEVNVLTGYVDSIRFENYIKNEHEIYSCDKLKKEVDINEPLCEKSTCKGCLYKTCDLDRRDLGILVTCFEVKITKSDFKSINGHNFIGNKNYYVIPKDLYKDVKNLIEKDIGVILYYKNGALRLKKECAIKDISESKLNLYLFNALKKWCDTM